MHDNVLSSSNVDKLNRYLFDYRFDGAEYSIDVWARSPREAEAKLQAISHARYSGEIKALIPIPSAGLIGRIFARVFQS